MYILKPILAWIIAQCLKFLIEGLQERKFNYKRLLGAGGMPSSHAALTVALTTSVGKDLGITDPVTATALVFTLVVLYDATGIRREAGRQAEAINKLIEELKQHRPITEQRLKELLGHTPLQVLVGSLLGFLVGFYI